MSTFPLQFMASHIVAALLLTECVELQRAAGCNKGGLFALRGQAHD